MHIHPLPLLPALVILSCAIAGGLENDLPRTPSRVAPGSSRVVNPVEPLSLPLRLSMTAAEVLAQFGKPDSDNRSFGGGLAYPDFRVLFDATGREIWTVVLRDRVRLACGVGVGDSLERVREAFPSGQRVRDAYQVEIGQYAVTFDAPAGQVSQITLRPSGRRFVDPGAEGKPENKRTGLTLKSLVGRWLDPRNGQSLELSPDGTYRTGAGGKGTFKVDGDRLTFTGSLATWDGGKATLSQPDVIEFYWTNPEGAKSYFAFLRAKVDRSDPSGRATGAPR